MICSVYLFVSFLFLWVIFRKEREQNKDEIFVWRVHGWGNRSSITQEEA